MMITLSLVIPLVATACSVERAQVASEAQNKMLGMSSQQVLVCMGAPERQAKVGETEVWSYASGGDKLPGAKGVGPKGAASLLRRYGTLEEALANDKFKDEAD